MKELIKIKENNGKKLVDARELHSFLESKKDFSSWIKAKIKKYGFIENEDYTSFTQKGEREIGATTRIEYALTLDMAKEIAMAEASDKGRQARRYFIECEKKLQSLTKEVATLSKHTQRPVQIENSKAVNAYQWAIGGQASIVEYNREHCKKLTGKSPSELKELGKKIGLKSNQYSSGKEVLRNIRPDLACRMSLDDDFVKHGLSLNEAVHITAGTEKLFSKMIELGMKPAELKAS